MNRNTFLKTLAGAAALSMTGLAALAQSGEPIKVGEINHYKQIGIAHV